MLTAIFSFIAGVFCLLAYMLFRMMRNDGWDDSNITNALRLLSHVVLHAEDFGKMYYLKDTDKQRMGEFFHGLQRPFWYVSKDEFEGVVKTRPRG